MTTKPMTAAAMKGDRERCLDAGLLSRELERVLGVQLLELGLELLLELFEGELQGAQALRLELFDHHLKSTTLRIDGQRSESEDGKTITFAVRSGLKFHSGNPVRAEDVAWSLQRVVKLNKTPAFIITQFGWTADNVDDLIQVVDGERLKVTITEEYSPVLVLNALSAGVGSVIDEKLVMENEVDGDLGYAWLKNHSAGSGKAKGPASTLAIRQGR